MSAAPKPPADQGNGARRRGIVLTRFTSDYGSIGKHFKLDKNGHLAPSTNVLLSRGKAETLTLSGLEGLQNQILLSVSKEAFGFGVMKDGRTSSPIVTQENLAKNPGAIARDKEHFEFSPGTPGALFLDFDPDHAENPLTDFLSARAAIIEAVPALRMAPILWRMSSSSHIRNSATGEELTGVRGMHGYILVADQADIPRAGAALFDRLWLNGLGHFVTSASGRLNRRSIIDGSVWQAERMVFIEPEFDPPLRRESIAMKFDGDSQELFDTRLIADLNAEERGILGKLIIAARQRAAPEAKRKREAWVTNEVKRYIKANKGTAKALAVAMFRAAVEQGTLQSEFVLYPRDGEPVRVSQILADPMRWHGVRFRDPLEPDYRDDDRIAILNTRTGARHSLFSHAHSEQRFYLQPERVQVQLSVGNEDNATAQALHVIREQGEIYESGAHTLVRVCEGRLEPISATYMQDYLGRFCQFVRFDKKANKLLPKDTPSKVAEYIMERHGERLFLNLDAIVTAPVLRLDGSMLDTPGYDAVSKLFYYTSEIYPQSIPLNPSIEQAQKALDKLWLPVSQFEFISAWCDASRNFDRCDSANATDRAGIRV